jgi:hypothetical protein
MRPAPTRTRRASKAVTAAASRVHRTCHGPCFVLAALGHVPRQVLRGRRCRTSSMQQRASHPRGSAARPIPDANARLRARSPARPWFTVRRSLPASQGHEPRQQSCHGSCSYPPAVSCSLRTSSVMPTLITKSGTEHATASGAVWLRHFNASLLLIPCRRPRRSRAFPCGTRTASTLDAGLCAGSS